MNNWQSEKMAEFHRQDLINESKRIHIVTPAKRKHTHRANLVTRTKLNLANWMIAKGQMLRKSNEARTFSHVHQ